MTTGAEVVAVAKSYENTPQRHLGRLKGVAIDCLGLGMCVVRDLALPRWQDLWNDPRLQVYDKRSPGGPNLPRVCDEYMSRIVEPTLGDVLVMSFGGNPQHFAIVSRISPLYGNPTYLIHCYNLVGKVVEEGVNVAKAKIVRAYRFPGVE